MEEGDRVRLRMRLRVRRLVARIFVALTVGVLALGSAAATFAGDTKEKKAKSPPAAAAKGKPPAGEAINACGCYRDSGGGCVCTDRKGKCECPGECEPVGCGEKRDKEIEREMAAEIKRAQDDEKKQQAEKDAIEARENGTAVTPDAGEAPPTVAAKPSKPPRKDPAGKGQVRADKTDKAEKK
jgi:hypothetical protein